MAEDIRTMCEDYAEYLRDESRSIGAADTISFPRTEQEVRRILRAEYEAGHRITVQGARTGLAAAAVPQGGHIMNMMKMDRVLGMRQDAAGRFYLTVQPGVILSRLKKQIESKKLDTTGWDDASLQAYRAFLDAPEQLLTPDPTEGSASIGGIVACNASGARSFLYGPARGHVSALRVVLTDGDVLQLRRGEVFAEGRTMTLTTGSGRVMRFDLPTYTLPKTKNASGYYIADGMDAIDLFIGSDGTLGITTSVELSLLPMPAVIWGVTCFFSQEADAVRFVCALRDSVDQLASLEYFNGDSLELLRQQRRTHAAFSQLPDLPQRFGCAVYTELHCADEDGALERLLRIGQIMTQCGGREDDTWVARNGSDRDRLYFFRHAIPESVNMRIDRLRRQDPVITKLGSDMSVPDEHLSEVIAMYDETLSQLGLESAKFGHIGNNHLHVNILPRNADEYRAGKALFAQWAREVTRMGGAVSAEHGVGKLKADFLRIMYGEAHIAEMARLKAVFDPRGLLGTGNLFTPCEEVQA